MLESITSNVLSVFAALPIAPAIDAMETVLTDQRAFNYARETLRSEYESQVRPATYDGVVENFRIGRQDLIDYFLGTSSPTKKGLEEHLLERLANRVANWSHNTPSPALTQSMLRRFYETYERYFVTVDPLLTNLTVMALSTEARQLLTEIQAQISLLATRLSPPPKRETIAADVELLLKVTGTAFDVIESTDDHMDVRVVEPHSLVAVSHVFSVIAHAPGTADVDALKERVAAGRDNRSQVFIVTPRRPSEDVAAYARRRGIEPITTEDLRLMLTRTAAGPSVLVGRIAAASLASSLNVDRLYIPADAVPTRPGDPIENEFYTKRLNVDRIIDDFLADETARLLVVLGDYGSGKSVTAAHTLARFSDRDGEVCAAYVPLAQVDRPELLSDVTRRADTALQALYPKASRHLVILDGVDELRDAISPSNRKTNMLRLLDATTKTHKLLVTARTSYFHGLDDFWSLFSRERDPSLWEKLARFIPEGAARPRVQAVVLREFDSDKILDYLTEYARVEQREESFATDFLAKVQREDPDGVYQRLMRSPLYLFLIVNTNPWEDSSVQSVADVIRLFIRYWLERDVGKGPSRWLLSTEDRTDFVRSVAWKMFQTRRVMITYDEFDRFVAEYFQVSPESDDAKALGLDLHTTGVFHSVGRWLFFAVPAFGEYFVATRFYEGFDDADWPTRLPTTAEARMWLGLLLTPAGRGEPFAFGDPEPQADAWMRKMRLSDADAPRVRCDLTGIVYRSDHDRLLEDFNGSAPTRLRVVIREALAGHSTAERSDKRIRLHIVNRLGLHARATAVFTFVLNHTFDDGSEVLAIKGDETVDARSILGLLLLAAGCGATIDLQFARPNPEKLFTLCKLIHATPIDGSVGEWRCDFGERDAGRGRVEYVLDPQLMNAMRISRRA